ncbi:unnamed protein product [Prorocentrum cordatum]|nr:unnamed protein product [Polarella glacialis]
MVKYADAEHHRLLLSCAQADEGDPAGAAAIRLCIRGRCGEVLASVAEPSMLRSLLLLGLLACACSSDSAQWKDEDYEDDGLEVQQPAIAGSASGFKGVGANSSEAGAKAAALKVPVKYGTSWKELVTGGSCPDETPLTPKTSDAAGGVITCEKTSAGGRKLKFPAGMFDIDEQVVVPANTEIVGNANPVDPDDKDQGEVKRRGYA